MPLHSQTVISFDELQQQYHVMQKESGNVRLNTWVQGGLMAGTTVLSACVAHEQAQRNTPAEQMILCQTGLWVLSMAFRQLLLADKSDIVRRIAQAREKIARFMMQSSSPMHRYYYEEVLGLDVNDMLTDVLLRLEDPPEPTHVQRIAKITLDVLRQAATAMSAFL